MRQFKLFAAMMLLGFSSGIFLYAQEDEYGNLDSLKEYSAPSITVTANKAEKRKSPVPFEEITQSEISDNHTVKDITLMLSELPSLITYSESGNFIGYSNIKMRGFDQRRIAVMVNGVPQNDPEDHNMYWINLADITSSLDNIQVQRGAGVSAYGAAAIGGSINLTTSDFVKQKGVKVYSGVGYQTFGEYDEIRANTSKFAFEASSGLIDDKYAVYTRLTRINSFGYRDQSWAFMNGYFMSAARFDNNFSTQINVYGGNQYDGLVYNGIAKSWNDDLSLRRSNYSYWAYDESGNVIYDTPRRDVAVEEFSQPHYEILNDWQINENLKLKSTLFFYTGEGYFDFSGAGWTDASTFFLTPEYGWEEGIEPQNTLIRAWVGNKHGGWIPRLTWKNDRHETTVGLEMRLHRSEHWGKIEYAENLPTGFDPNYKFYEYDGKRDIFSIFASERYFLTDKFILSAEGQLVRHTYKIGDELLGGRYSEYNSTDGLISGNDDIFDVKYLFFNPRIGANYNFTDRQNAYISFAYTQREPRMKNLYDASDAATGGAVPLFAKDTVGGSIVYDFDEPIVKPEKMFNIETGWSFKSDKFYINTNFYWMEYYDELVKSGQLDIFGQPVDGNAPRTRHYGIELSGSAILFHSLKFGQLELSGNFTYSQNKIIDFDYITSSGDEISLEDNNIAGFPDLMGNMRISYKINDLYASVLLKYVGEFRTDNFGDMLTENQKIIDDLAWDYYDDNLNDAYTVLNANLNYTFRNILSLNTLTIQMQVLNLTNELYMQNGIGKEFFPAAERSVFFGIELGI
jgi:iron complex outermembrane receptor protein